jgi:hypothetical protein
MSLFTLCPYCPLDENIFSRFKEVTSLTNSMFIMVQSTKDHWRVSIEIYIYLSPREPEPMPIILNRQFVGPPHPVSGITWCIGIDPSASQQCCVPQVGWWVTSNWAFYLNSSKGPILYQIPISFRKLKYKLHLYMDTNVFQKAQSYKKK